MDTALQRRRRCRQYPRHPDTPRRATELCRRQGRRWRCRSRRRSLLETFREQRWREVMWQLSPIVHVGTTNEQRRRTVGAFLALPTLPVALPTTRVQGGMAPRVRLGNERDRRDAAAATHLADLADRRSTRGAPRVPGRKVQPRRPRPHLWEVRKMTLCHRLPAAAAAICLVILLICPLIMVARGGLMAAAATSRGGLRVGALPAPTPLVRMDPDRSLPPTRPRVAKVPLREVQ